MTSTISCKHCGHSIAFSAEDRGSEVYCGSCGRSNLVPLIPAAVFTADAAAGLWREVVGEETCLCGQKVPVRIEDVGEAVYCPACGTEIRVGETLSGGKYPSALPVKAETAGENTPAPLGQAEPSHPRRRTILVFVLVALLAVAAGGALAWSLSSGGGSPAFKRKMPAETGTANKSRPQVPPARSPHENDLTPADVAGLLSHADPMAALVQARLWQDRLHLEEAGDEDPRRSKLREVVAALESRLSPAAEPADRELTEFRRRLDQMADGLKQGDLESARRAMNAAEDLLRRHPAQLAPCEDRLRMLQARLAEELELGGAARRIAELFRAADRHLAANRVTEAMETEAQARFLALTSALSSREAETLDVLARELRARLRFARGQRAVADARRCHEAGDAESRDREVRRALELLPGLPENRVAPLLMIVAPWVESARASKVEEGRATDESPGSLSPPSPFRLPPSANPSSAVGRQIHRRDCYESIWEFYANGEANRVLPACRELDALLAENGPDLQELRKRVEAPLFHTMKREIRERLDRGADH